MTIHEKPPPGGDRDGGSGMSIISDNSFKPPRQKYQDKSQAPAAGITSMRADELRACLVREILRASAIGMQAQAALLDGDDDTALETLRRHWRIIRAGIAPLAAELQDLVGGRA
jgi:hypothetical protein